jgi:uncharacterized coiled-coil protein SlyX
VASSSLDIAPYVRLDLRSNCILRAALVAQVTALQNQVNSLQTQVNAQQTQITTLQSQVSSLQTSNTTLQSQVTALQNQLTAAQPVLALAPFVSVDANSENGVAGPNIKFTGANIHILSGSGATDDNLSHGGSLTGLGNLIIGYDEIPFSTPAGFRADRARNKRLSSNRCGAGLGRLPGTKG